MLICAQTANHYENETQFTLTSSRQQVLHGSVRFIKLTCNVFQPKPKCTTIKTRKIVRGQEVLYSQYATLVYGEWCCKTQINFETQRSRLEHWMSRSRLRVINERLRAWPDLSVSVTILIISKGFGCVSACLVARSRFPLVIFVLQFEFCGEVIKSDFKVHANQNLWV
jgi:hypothetical protein